MGIDTVTIPEEVRGATKTIGIVETGIAAAHTGLADQTGDIGEELFGTGRQATAVGKEEVAAAGQTVGSRCHTLGTSIAADRAGQVRIVLEVPHRTVSNAAVVEQIPVGAGSAVGSRD